ncbi:MAG: sigma 54-interacting transcriptional regulator, partial [Nitrospiria bacterium]
RTEATILSRIDPRARPTRIPGLFLRGQFEGFPALFGGGTRASFDEEFSQVGLVDLLREFEGYELTSGPHEIVIKDRRNGSVAATAEGITLALESIPMTDRSAAEDGEVVVGPGDGAYAVHTSIGSSVVPIAKAQAFRILRGGSLRRGPVVYPLVAGAIYGAPYSRYRYRWTDVRTPSVPSEVRLRTVSRLLFTHLHELKHTQRRLLRSERDNLGLRAENAHLKLELADRHRFEDLVVHSHAMKRLCAMLERVVETDATVLLLGETGSGKEVIARALHYNGPRKDQRFLAVNCGALHEGLLESELFGHERGAFTGALQRRIGKFESATGGTMFLDEIGELSPALQVKLLRVLQERAICRVGGNDDIPVNIRVIAATHRNLQAMVKTGSFRQDLYYRLNVVPLSIPPLRERAADIPFLTEILLTKLCDRLQRPVPRWAPEAMRIVLNHRWPGNVRELENVIERALILAGRDMLIQAAHLPPEWFRSEEGGVPAAGDPWTVIATLDWSAFSRFFEAGGSFDDLLGRIEWAITQRAVDAHQGNKSHAARTLKRSYRWLRKLEKAHLGPSPPSDV